MPSRSADLEEATRTAAREATGKALAALGGDQPQSRQAPVVIVPHQKQGPALG